MNDSRQDLMVNILLSLRQKNRETNVRIQFFLFGIRIRILFEIVF